MTAGDDRSQRLTSAEMAQFVARGFLVFEAVVPEVLNAAALELFARTGAVDMARPKPDSGTPLADIYPDPSPIGAMLRLPRVAGIIESLVGSDPVYDHDWVHVREPGDLVDQHLHQDAIVDTTLAFDVQVFWFPHEVGPGEGGTGFVPGSHLRVVNEFDVARYQNLLGQRDVTGPAGTIAVFHQGMWHRGRANRGGTRRTMYKIRLNPTRPQVRQWNLDDLDEVQGAAHDHIFATYRDETAAGRFRRPEAWFEAAASRLETVNRSRLWRYLTGDDGFDADWYLSRTEGRELIDGGAGVSLRQQVLFLYLASSALDAAVVGWSSYDGAGEGPTPPVEAEPTPPYRTGLEALRDGWRLLQVSPLTPPSPGAERRTSFLHHEFVFEKLVEVTDR